MKSLQLFLTSIIFLSVASTSWGNTGVFYGSGNQVIPIKNDQIQLVKENVNIKLTIEENNGRFGVPFIPWANVTAKFNLKNTTKDKVSLQMGFPFLDLQGFGDEEYVLDNLDFKFIDNGNEIKTEVKEGLIEEKFDPDGLFKKVFAWSANFNPSEEREVVVTYKMLMGVVSANSVFREFDDEDFKYSDIDDLFPALSYNFSYITKTAYTWAGSIDNAIFELDCSSFRSVIKDGAFLKEMGMEDPGYRSPIFWESIYPPPDKGENGVYSWVFKEKVPEEGLAFTTMAFFVPGNPSELRSYYEKSISRLEDVTADEFRTILKDYYQILAFGKEPTAPFEEKYFKDIRFLKMPKTFIFESDKTGIEEIANNFDKLINE